MRLVQNHFLIERVVLPVDLVDSERPKEELNVTLVQLEPMWMMLWVGVVVLIVLEDGRSPRLDLEPVNRV